MTANEIRESFLKFFASQQHLVVPSAPMVVKDDPTLMFTNAGMNQFKDIYGERIFSRIMSCYKFLAFVGEDIREQKRTVSP